MFTIKDVMSEYKVSKRTVYNWIDQGLPFIKVGKLIRFEPSAVREWFLNQNSNK